MPLHSWLRTRIGAMRVCRLSDFSLFTGNKNENAFNAYVYHSIIIDIFIYIRRSELGLYVLKPGPGDYVVGKQP